MALLLLWDSSLVICSMHCSCSTELWRHLQGAAPRKSSIATSANGTCDKSTTKGRFYTKTSHSSGRILQMRTNLQLSWLCSSPAISYRA